MSGRPRGRKPGDPWKPSVRLPFTPRFVDEAQALPGQERSVYWDTHPEAPRGFCLRVRVTGARSFYFLKTVKATGRRPWVRIGEAQGAGLADARRQAWKVAAAIMDNRDPNIETKESRLRAKVEALQRVTAVDEWTVLDLLRAYVEARVQGDRLAPSTHTAYLIHTRDVANAVLGGMKAREVLRNDIRDLVARQAIGTPSKAAHMLSFLSAAFRWGMDEETIVTLDDGRKVARARIDRDPTRRIFDDLPKVKAASRAKRKRVLTDEEIKTLWRGLDQLELCWASMPRVILLCGTRRAETHKAEWSHVTLEGTNPTWHIPAPHRKGRAGARRELDIPLAPFAAALFRNLLPITGRRKRVFVAQGLFVGGVGQELKRVTGLNDVTLHDLRRTCSTGLQRLGCPPHIISVVLGRAREAGTTATDDAYLHDRRPGEHRAWLQKWANHIEKLVGDTP